MEQRLAAAVREALTQPAALAAVRELYDELQQVIDARSPRCELSGRCCRFEQYGHRLYVSTLELAAFLAQLQVQCPEADTAGCPFQQARWCSVHGIRPFGCRMFFCDPAAEQWQSQQYERFHARLKRLHDQFGVTYCYVEWREALCAVGAMPPAAP